MGKRALVRPTVAESTTLPDDNDRSLCDGHRSSYGAGGFPYGLLPIVEGNMRKRSGTSFSVGLLLQLYQNKQLHLAPEFQRSSVWPRSAKAYLIDTILNDKPIPLLFFQRRRSVQTGRPTYDVVDGQQRLRAIFEFLDDRFPLSASTEKRFRGKFWKGLSKSLQGRVLDYDLPVEELAGYSDADVRDMFVRMNKYVVKLSPQELRHAKQTGAFAEKVEHVGTWSFWKDQRVFTANQLARMKAAEFAAELLILLIEGPQDKKRSVDLYYGRYQRRFPDGRESAARLQTYLAWIRRFFTDFKRTRFRKPTDFYSLIGAIDEKTKEGSRLKRLDPVNTWTSLRTFDHELAMRRRGHKASAYLEAASRQTDNIAPRTTRIDILNSLLQMH